METIMNAAPCGCTFETTNDPVPGRVVDRCPIALDMVEPAAPHDFDWDAYSSHLDTARAILATPALICVNHERHHWAVAPGTDADHCPYRQPTVI